MTATRSASRQPVLIAGQNRAKCMPSSMSTASTNTIETGVSASVSLFALVRTLSTLLLASLVVLLGLSGLTGLIISLVGLTTGLAPNARRGD